MTPERAYGLARCAAIVFGAVIWKPDERRLDGERWHRSRFVLAQLFNEHARWIVPRVADQVPKPLHLAKKLDRGGFSSLVVVRFDLDLGEKPVRTRVWFAVDRDEEVLTADAH